MSKVVINVCYGGYSLSEEAILWLIEQGCEEARAEYAEMAGEWRSSYLFSPDRSNMWLVKVVEELAEKAGGMYTRLKVVDVPDDINWHIVEYDGWEHVAEDLRTWS